MYSEASFRERTIYTDPEIRRNPESRELSTRTTMLDLGAIDEFPFLAPTGLCMRRTTGMKLSSSSGAIDRRPMLRGEGAGQDQRPALTPVGRQMARVPADPRIAKYLIRGVSWCACRGACARGCPFRLRIRASVRLMHKTRPIERRWSSGTNRQISSCSLRCGTSIGMSRVEAVDRRCGSGAEHYLCLLAHVGMDGYARATGAIAEELDLPPNSVPASEEAIHKSLLTGLISNLACREEGQASYDYRGVRGNVGLSIFPGSEPAL